MYYKVVNRLKNGTLCSACVSTVLNDEFILEYKINKWTVPVKGTSGIFIFSQMENAINFSKDNGKYEDFCIFECKVIEAEYCETICGSNISERVLDFWNREMFKSTIDKKPWYTHNAPLGSYIAKAIKLTKEIECFIK